MKPLTEFDMTGKKPKSLMLSHVRSEESKVILQFKDKTGKDYEGVFEAPMVTHLMAMLRTALEDVSTIDAASQNFPLNVYKVEIGEAQTPDGVRQGMRIFVSEKLHHDYYFAAESDQKELVLDMLLKASRGYGIEALPPKKKLN
jgi:hypothetical protein